MQTLAEGLEEYYAANAGIVTRPSNLPPESVALFKGHDTGHVIFGLSTSLTDEAMADTRILLSTDAGFWRYSRYLTADEQTKAIFKQVGYGKVALYTLLAVRTDSAGLMGSRPDEQALAMGAAAVVSDAFARRIEARIPDPDHLRRGRIKRITRASSLKDQR